MISIKDLRKDLYKPKEVSLMSNLSVKTIQHYCKIWKLEETRTETDRRLIKKESLIALLNQLWLLYHSDDRWDAIYCRVSTNKQKKDLQRQIQYCINYVVDKNPVNLQIFQEIWSWLNDNRKELLKMLNAVQSWKIKRIFVLYKDRLSRFGFNYIKNICDFNNVELIIISNDESEKTIQEELAEDIISIIHSFSGNLYWLRKKIKDGIDISWETSNKISFQRTQGVW